MNTFPIMSNKNWSYLHLIENLFREKSATKQDLPSYQRENKTYHLTMILSYVGGFN